MKIGPIRLCERKAIGREAGDGPLLIRWILVGTPLGGIYLHRLCRSDYDRALHDHPWPFVSIVLWGGYFEVHDQVDDCPRRALAIVKGPAVWRWRGIGSVAYRPAIWRHRIVIGPESGPVWTLMLVGPRQRHWGFHLPTGWCWWRKHNPAKNICEDDVIWTHGRD